MSLLTLFIEDDDDMAIPVVTWATLPAASSATGKRYRVSDVGPNGSDWISNGTAWEPVQGIVMLARSAVAASVTGTLSETTLATITLPAGLMGSNGQLRITTFWNGTNSANNKTCKIKLGAGIVHTQVNTTSPVFTQLMMVRNRNAANSQVCHPAISGSFTDTATTPTTLAIDTSVATTVTLTAQLANIGETLTIEAYTVELIR